MPGECRLGISQRVAFCNSARLKRVIIADVDVGHLKVNVRYKVDARNGGDLSKDLR